MLAAPGIILPGQLGLRLSEPERTFAVHVWTFRSTQDTPVHTHTHTHCSSVCGRFCGIWRCSQNLLWLTLSAAINKGLAATGEGCCSEGGEGGEGGEGRGGGHPAQSVFLG